MKRDDPVRLRLRAQRERAQLWLDILRRGIGKEMADGYRSCPEDVRALMERVNSELSDAADAVEQAEKAYSPYWGRRRRVHRYVSSKGGKNPKSTKKKKA
jgi:hypothetical protein